MVRASLEIGNSNQELMGKPGRRRWRMWLAAVIVFIIIIAVVVVAVVLLTGTKKDDDGMLPSENPIELEDIIKGKFQPERFNATWISDTKLLYIDRTGSLKTFDMESQTSTTLLSPKSYLYSVSFDQQLSPDHKYLLLAIGYRKLYRHSYSAQYIVLDLEEKMQYPIVVGENETYLELAIWGPKDNSIFFVYNNNLYYKKTVNSDNVQLTDDGVSGTIYNAVPDWVYEEEVFSSNKAIWFSEDGTRMVFAKFDDTLTRIMAIPFYGHPGDVESQYTRALTIRYPKAGTTNPTVTLVLVNLLDPKTKQIELPAPPALNEPILATVSFATNDAVVAVWTNRVQNESIILRCEINCTKIFEYKESNGWVDMLRPLIFTSDGSGFFTILPKDIDGDSWRQIALITDGEDRKLWDVKHLTNEKSTVTELLHWDESAQTLWYLATSAEDSAYQHLYNVNLEGQINCFTCKIQHSSKSDCLYNEAVMSKSGSYIVISCLGPQIPEIYVYNKEGQKMFDWENNENISTLLSEKDLPVISRKMVRVTDEPLPPAQVLLMVPRNADLSGITKYPLLVNVYGGPDSFQVLEKWNLDWGASIVSRWNIILAFIDGRGSGLKGNNNLFAGYRNLGTVEVNDQINVTRKLQHTLDYIDPKRTCIWGWSYGGYASALALARGGNVFKCAISVAPVTDWLYYDSIYTERYMGLPKEEDNAKGYTSAVLNTPEIAMALKNKKFMLVHGTLDDNVHFQQSMMLSRLLQQNDVLFTQLSYPDEDHGLNGVKHHLYHSLEKFLETNLLSKT